MSLSVATAYKYSLISFDLLPRLQGDDDEDGSSVHPAHTATVAHEVVQDGCEFRPHLSERAV